jgi:hypothetical protein
MKPVDDVMERELRAMRPQIDRDFAIKLDAWAAEGFPARGQSPAPVGKPKRRSPRLPLTLPRLAFAACMILIVGTVSVSALQDIGSEDDGGLSSSDEPANSTFPVDPQTGEAEVGGGGAQRQSQDDASVAAPEPTVPLPPGEEKLLPGQERKVARDASMRLSTEPDEVDDVADGVIEVTERYDGIVLSSDVEAQAERARATFDLRIPAQNLQATLADLSDLASVTERDEASLDVTAPFVSAEERFDDAKAEVDALVEQLGDAESADEIAQIRGQLQVARSELAAARSDLATLKQKTDFSTLAVTVTGDGDSGGWSLGDALDDAGSVLQDILGAALVALAAIVPLGLIAAALWFGVRAARRKARERTLDD